MISDTLTLAILLHLMTLKERKGSEEEKVVSHNLLAHLNDVLEHLQLGLPAL